MAASGHKDIAFALLEAGADVHAKDRLGNTALNRACDTRSQKEVQRLSASKDIALAYSLQEQTCTHS